MHRIVRLSVTAIARRTVVMKPCQRSIPLCSLYQHNNITINQLSHSSFSTLASQIGTEEEVAELTAWAPTFTKASLPLDKFDVRNARSRGAGGQNVNKVNTKVDMRFKLDSAQWLPVLVRKVLRQSEKNRVNTEGEFIMTSERHRTQGENYDDCVQKLYECIKRASEVDNPTPEHKKQKIEKLARKADEARIKEKKQMKSRKESRRGSRDGW